MKKATYIALAGLTLAATQFADAQGFKVRNRETKAKTTETLAERDFRIKAEWNQRQSGLQAEQTNSMVNFLSAMTRGQSDSTQLKAGLLKEYQVQVPDAKSNSSKVVLVKINDMAQKISVEAQKIKDTNENALIGEPYNAFQARKIMVDQSSKLVAVASRKYAGTDANLVMARDAFARLVETTTKVMDSNSGATAREITEHNRIVAEIVKAKEQNDKLTDAEAMMIGAQRAQEIMADQTAKETGIQNNESAEAKAKRLQEYLKDLKECT